MEQENEDRVRLSERLHRSRGRGSRNGTANARVTKKEQEELENFATANGKTLSEWAREVLLREARQKGDPMLTELVAMRMLLNHVLPPIAEKHGVTADDFAGMIAEVRREKHEVTRQLREQYSGKLPQEQ